MKKDLTTLQTGLTYDKIIRDVDRRELRTGTVDQNWKNYIELARGLLAVAEVSRMAVAEVAIRATILKCGGDRHSLHFKNVRSKLTVKAFANSIGVKPNTLWLWMRIKMLVFDTLKESDRRRFKHDAGERAFRQMGVRKQLPSEKAKELYTKIANRTKEQKAADRAVKQIFGVRKVFRHYIKYLSPEQITTIRVALLEILKIIEEL